VPLVVVGEPHLVEHHRDDDGHIMSARDDVFGVRLTLQYWEHVTGPGKHETRYVARTADGKVVGYLVQADMDGMNQHHGFEQIARENAREHEREALTRQLVDGAAVLANLLKVLAEYDSA
jgi:hypothetical protein